MIDCDTCPVRGRRCNDCIVPLLVPGWGMSRGPDDVGAPEAAGPSPGSKAAPDPRPLPLDRAERAAVGTFVRAGLIAPAAADRLRAVRAGRDLSAVG